MYWLYYQIDFFGLRPKKITKTCGRIDNAILTSEYFLYALFNSLNRQKNEKHRIHSHGKCRLPVSLYTFGNMGLSSLFRSDYAFLVKLIMSISFCDPRDLAVI